MRPAQLSRALGVWALWCVLGLVPARAQVPNAWNVASATGTGGAGVARTDDGPGIQAHNPAALGWQRGVTTEFGGAAVVPLYATQDTRQPWGAPRHRSRVAPAFPPAVFVAHGTGQVAAGVGVHAPFLWSVVWPGGMHLREERRMVVVNPAVAYRVGRISVGLGVQGAAGWVEGAREHVGPSGTTALTYRGPGTGVGFQVGVQFAAWDGLTLGVHHRSRMLLGDVLDLRSQGAGALPTGTAYRAQVLPDVFTAGLAWRMRPGTQVHAEMSLSTWGAGTADVFQSGGGARPAVSFPRRWRDGVAVRGGVEQALYMVAPDLRVKAGAWLQQSPLEWGQTRLDAPLLDQGGVSAGLGWRLFGFAVDAAYLGGVGVPQPVMQGGVEHRLWSMVHGVVVSLGWRWSPPMRPR